MAVALREALRSAAAMQSLYAAAPSWAPLSNVGLELRRRPCGVAARAASASMAGMGAFRSKRGWESLSSANSRPSLLQEVAVLSTSRSSSGLSQRRPIGSREERQPLGLGVGLPVRAQAAAGGTAVPSQAPKKILGIDAITFKKVVPLGLMFFCILFNYTILRDTKDVLVVTAKGSSAEIIPFLKTWVNLPMAIGFMVIYTKLSNVLSKESLFYSCIFPFIAFFGAFAFFMYPLVDVLHPTAFADWALQKLGSRFMGPIAIIRNWTFVLFYVMAELWGSVVVSVLFWGFANQVCSSAT